MFSDYHSIHLISNQTNTLKMNIYKIETSEVEFWAARNLSELKNAYKEDKGKDLPENKVTSIPESEWPQYNVYDRKEESESGGIVWIGSFDELVILESDPFVLNAN